MSGYRGSFASLMRSRTQAAPPRRLHFSHSSSVIRIGLARMTSPVLLMGFRPCPRSPGGRGSSVLMHG